jgi:hypothetical protein
VALGCRLGRLLGSGLGRLLGSGLGMSELKWLRGTRLGWPALRRFAGLRVGEVQIEVAEGYQAGEARIGEAEGPRAVEGRELRWLRSSILEVVRHAILGWLLAEVRLLGRTVSRAIGAPGSTFNLKCFFSIFVWIRISSKNACYNIKYQTYKR